jgi:hypothetical protein
MRRLVASALIIACLALSLPISATANGGNSISAAPLLNLGTEEAAGGPEVIFWRVPLFAGDVLKVDTELPPDSSFTYFNLFSPAVTDFTFEKELAVAHSEALVGGKHEFTMTSPFTGLASFVVCGYDHETCRFGGVPVKPLTFVATVSHATHLTLTAPVVARRHSLVTVRVFVQSSAGTPQGSCLIQGGLAGLNGGRCSRRLRLGRQSTQLLRAEFVPQDGWRAAKGTRKIRLVR